jgi:Circadian oscillating protein COP23
MVFMGILVKGATICTIKINRPYIKTSFNSMKKIGYLCLYLSIFTVNNFLNSSNIHAQEQPKIRFACKQIEGVYNTVAIINNDDDNPKIIIKWVSNTLKRYPPEQRCKSVSEKFQTYNDMGELKFLTTGVINRQNVICVAKAKKLDCNRELPNQGLIFTLKPGQSGKETLRQLIDNKNGDNEPLLETQGRTYVDLRKKIYGDQEINSQQPTIRKEVESNTPATNSEKPCLFECGN